MEYTRERKEISNLKPLRQTTIRIFEPEMWEGELNLPVQIGETGDGTIGGGGIIGVPLNEENLRELLNGYGFEEFISD